MTILYNKKPVSSEFEEYLSDVDRKEGNKHETNN